MVNFQKLVYNTKETWKNGRRNTIIYRSVQEAINTLLSSHQFTDVQKAEIEKNPLISWRGKEMESILVFVSDANNIPSGRYSDECFFFDFCYRGAFEIRYHLNDMWMRVVEGDTCIGQPFAQHEIRPLPDENMLVVHICIRRELFFRYFLPMFTSDSNLFHILMDVPEPGYEKQFIIHTDQTAITRSLIDLIMVEYSLYRENNQTVLRPLILSLIMDISRYCEMTQASSVASDLAHHIVQYISEHSSTVTLNELSERFSYNPNYISTLLPRETGKTFSKHVFEQRMQKAVSLLKSTQMSISEIASDLGYSNSSNFYKDFHSYCSISPSKYREQNKSN